MGTWHYHQNAPGDTFGYNDSGIFAVHDLTLYNGKVLWFSGHIEEASGLAFDRIEEKKSE